jgi:hypothetical protein
MKIPFDILLSVLFILAQGLPIHCQRIKAMRTFIGLAIWCLLLVVCWPLALAMLFLFPIVWLILLPFRIVGLTIGLLFSLIGAVLMFPFRILKS